MRAGGGEREGGGDVPDGDEQGEDDCEGGTGDEVEDGTERAEDELWGMCGEGRMYKVRRGMYIRR